MSVLVVPGSLAAMPVAGAAAASNPPVINSFEPAIGIPGQSVTISGPHVGDATAVAFNGVAAESFGVLSPSRATAVVPLAATSGPISVTTPAGVATSSSSFTVPPPLVLLVQPNQAMVGQTVMIWGFNFAGVTAVRFNGAVATSFTILSPIEIQAFVPSDATTGPVSVTAASGTATSALPFTIVQAPQTIRFTSTAPPDATALGATYTPTASATSGLPVVLTVDAATSSTCTISGGTVGFLAGGSCTIDANQAGSQQYLPAPQVAQTFQVAKASQAIAFTSTVPAAAFVGGATYFPSATATSRLPVSLTVDPASGNACSMSGDVISFAAAGTCVIDASQGGNASWNPAPEAQQNFTVSPGSQVINFAQLTDQKYDSGSMTVGASASSGLAVSFDSDTPSVCTITTATISFVAAGTCTVRAAQSGDANWLSAPDVTESFSITYASVVPAGSAATVSSQAADGPTLTIPAGAFPSGASLEIAPAVSPDPSAAAGAEGPAFQVATSAEPLTPVELSIPFDPTASGPVSGVTVAWWSETTATWQAAQTTYDAMHHALVATVPHLTTFAWVTNGRVTRGPTFVIPPANDAAPFTDCPALGVIGSRGSGENSPGDPSWGEGLGFPNDAFALDLGRDLPGVSIEYTYNAPPGYEAIDVLTKAEVEDVLVDGSSIYFDSVRSGAASLLTMIAREHTECPNTVLVLAGYSQGAQLTGDLYESLAENGPSSLFNAIGGVVLFGDPLYDHTDPSGQVDGLQNNGLLTSDPWSKPPHQFATNATGNVLSYCISADTICQGAGQGEFAFIGWLTGKLGIDGLDPHSRYTRDGYSADAAELLATKFASLAGPQTYWASASAASASNQGDSSPPLANPSCTVPAPPNPCSIPTAYGFVADDSQVFLNTYPKWVPLTRPLILPIANSDAFFSIDTSPAYTGGVNLFYYKDFPSSITANKDILGNVLSYTVTATPDARLRDANGNLQSVDANSLAFSSNNKWFVAASPAYMVLVGLDPLQTFAFGLPTQYDLGQAPNYHMAVSDDGRYVAFGQVDNGSSLFIEDLTKCAPPAPNTIIANMLVTGNQCQTIDVSAAVRAVVPGYVLAQPWQFTDERTLVVYAFYKDANGIVHEAKVTLTSAAK